MSVREDLNMSVNNVLLASMLLNEKTEIKEFISTTTRDTTNIFHVLIIHADTVFAKCGKWLKPTDTAITQLTTVGHIFASTTHFAGTVLYGMFQDVELTSGKVEAIKFGELE